MAKDEEVESIQTLEQRNSLRQWFITSSNCQALTCNSAGSRRPRSEGDQRLGGTRPLKFACFQIQLFSLLVFSNYIYIDSLYTSLVITNKLISIFIRQLTGRRKIQPSDRTRTRAPRQEQNQKSSPGLEPEVLARSRTRSPRQEQNQKSSPGLEPEILARTRIRSPRQDQN